jgi:hypothetical protein
LIHWFWKFSPVTDVASILGPGGRIAARLTNYEHRPQQVAVEPPAGSSQPPVQQEVITIQPAQSLGGDRSGGGLGRNTLPLACDSNAPA